MDGHRCFWPGCPKSVPPNRLMCYRHYSRLSGNLRGWVAAKFNRADLDVKDSESRRAAFAARRYAVNHPDPELPPFEPGQLIEGKIYSIFQSCRFTVDECVLSDSGKWLVIVAGTGEVLQAIDFERAKT